MLAPSADAAAVLVGGSRHGCMDAAIEDVLRSAALSSLSSSPPSNPSSSLSSGPWSFSERPVEVSQCPQFSAAAGGDWTKLVHMDGIQVEMPLGSCMHPVLSTCISHSAVADVLCFEPDGGSFSSGSSTSVAESDCHSMCGSSDGSHDVHSDTWPITCFIDDDASASLMYPVFSAFVSCSAAADVPCFEPDGGSCSSGGEDAHSGYIPEDAINLPIIENSPASPCLFEAQALESALAMRRDTIASTGCSFAVPVENSPTSVQSGSYFCHCWRLCHRIPGVEVHWTTMPGDTQTRCTAKQARAQAEFLIQIALPAKSAFLDLSITLTNPCGFHYSVTRQPSEALNVQEEMTGGRQRLSDKTIKRALKVLAAASPCTMYAVSLQVDGFRSAYHRS